MFCTSCGTQLEDGAKFCTSCGKAVDQLAAPAPAAAPIATAAPASYSAPAPAPVAPQSAPATSQMPQAAADALENIKDILATGENLKHLSIATAYWGFGLLIACLAYLFILVCYSSAEASIFTVIATILFLIAMALAAVGVIGVIVAGVKEGLQYR